MTAPNTGKQRKRYRSMVWWMAVAAFVIGCAAGWGWMTGYLPVSNFDSASWKAQQTHYTRVRMVSALLMTHDLTSMTKSEVIDLLGRPPHSAYFLGWDFVYYLGPERGFFGMDSEWLVLRFSQDGRVSEWALVRD